MKTINKTVPKVSVVGYEDFLEDIKKSIQNSRIKASYQVNNELISLYLKIGKHIVERQEKYNWGKSVVEKLSKDLRKAYPNTQGYSTPNLWFMRQFHLEYCDNQNLLQLVREIPWGHNILIMTKLKSENEREFYIRSTIEMKWSRNVLLNQIKANTYRHQKLAVKQNNFKSALPVHVAEQADEAMKDIYTLDFLGIRMRLSPEIRPEIEIEKRA